MDRSMAGPRERIIRISTDLFARQGYNSTGINQIISEADVAKASFYKHFKSKEDLCVEYLKLRHQFWFNELMNFASKENDPKLKVLCSFNFLIYMNKKEQFRGCSFLNILSEIPADNSKILDVIKSHKSDLRAYFLHVLGNKAAAGHMYLLFESCLVESKLFGSNELIENAKQYVENLLY
jgi:AcrR family transcriptional regulator